MQFALSLSHTNQKDKVSNDQNEQSIVDNYPDNAGFNKSPQIISSEPYMVRSMDSAFF